MCIGSCEAPFLGWEALCDDLRESTLEHLSVRDLAGAAATCRDFQKAYLDRAAEERANLIASAKDAYGDGVFSGFVAGFQRAMLGLTAFPDDMYKEGESEVDEATCGAMLITNVGEPEYATPKEHEKWRSSNEPCAMIIKPFFASELLTGEVQVRHAEGNIGVRASSVWSMHRCGETHILLEVDEGIGEAALVLGLILAACRETPDASLQSPRNPLTIHLFLYYASSGLAGVREAEDLVAPLRSLAESVTVCRHPSRHGQGVRSLPPPDLRERRRPTGTLLVECRM
jgi:hypothetical protein